MPDPGRWRSTAGGIEAARSADGVRTMTVACLAAATLPDIELLALSATARETCLGCTLMIIIMVVAVTGWVTGADVARRDGRRAAQGSNTADCSASPLRPAAAASDDVAMFISGWTCSADRTTLPLAMRPLPSTPAGNPRMTVIERCARRLAVSVT